MTGAALDRFKEAAAKATDVKKGTDALFTAEDLQGLPSVFGGIGLLRDEKGKTVFRTERGPLKEVLDRIEIPEDTQRQIAAPLLAGKEPLPRTTQVPLLRSERDACEARLKSAIRRVQETVEGERLASVQVQPYFGAGIETEEQLDAALAGLRDECARLIGAGKKVVLS